MLRSISLSNRGLFFSYAWRRYYQSRNTIRTSHSQTKAPHSSDVIEGLFLHESINPAWSSTTPLTEVVSFDDFGFGSVHKLLTKPESKEISLHKFLDHLLRGVPTTVESCELGGSIELNEYERDNLETALSEGYDVSAVIGQLESDLDQQDPILIVKPPKRKPMVTPLAPVAGLAASAIDLSPMTDVHSIVLPHIPSTSFGIPEVIAVPVQQQILEAVDTKNIGKLNTILLSEQWPSASLLGSRVNEVLSFVIQYSTTTTESYNQIKNFLKTNPKFYLRDDLIVSLVIRDVRENGVDKSVEILRKLKNLSFVRSTGRYQIPRLQQLEKLFTAIAKNSKLSMSKVMFQTLIDLQIVSNDKAIRAWTKSMLDTDFSVENKVANWMKISTLTASCDGLDLLLNKLLQLDMEDANLIGAIFNHCIKIQSTFVTLTELLIALIKNKKIDEATMVFSTVYLHGKTFYRPLKRLVVQQDIDSIEILANLITKCMFEEKKIGRGKKKKNETQSVIQKSSFYTSLAEKINETTGVTSSLLIKPNSKIAVQEKKIKRHKVNENDLYTLSIAVRDAWFKLVTDKSDGMKLRAWCERNNIRLK